MNLDEDQAAAVDLILNERVGVVTGGPGTGKTTIIRTALQRLANTAHAVLLAPTGKAAKRLSQAAGFPAMTVHRYCKLVGTRFGLLSNDLVVVDEASMLDIPTANMLVQSIGVTQGPRLIFVGDVNQLPSVGPGQFLRDLIRTEVVPTVVLRTVHRAAETSWVYANAPKVLVGGPLDLRNQLDFEFVRCDFDDIPSVVASTAATHVASKSDYQVLSPQNRGHAGVHNLNQALQKARFGKGYVPDPGVGPRNGDDIVEAKIDGVVFEIGPGDVIIQTRNNYDLGVFNGDIGVVLSSEKGGFVVDIDDRLVSYSKAEAADIRLAYAITVHKSQGSEWDDVIVVCHSSHRWMWTRRLLYTAITRARRRVTLIGDREGLELALSNSRDAVRVSTLADRILELV